MFALLEQYKRREGHVTVRQPHKEGGEPLGTWLAHQRKRMNQGKLSASRRQRLQKLGVQLPKKTSTWQETYELLVGYKNREGHINISAQHRENDQNLGAWLMLQRSKIRHGTLSAEKAKKLKQLGVDEERRQTDT